MSDLMRVFRERLLYGENAGFDERIDPADEMLGFAAEQLGADLARTGYLRLGRDLARTVDQIANWRFGADTRATVRVLEFACGYGRNVRHLVRLFGSERLSVCDIQERAVDVVCEWFGVSGRVSTHDPRDFAWDQRFDLIIVPSLFSHLPDATFGAWLAVLHDLLTDRGILVFSTHGAHLIPREEMPAAGILFHPVNESTVLDPVEYGRSWVTEAYVADRVAAVLGNPTYSLTRRGFWNHQDFYIVPARSSDSVESYRYRYGTVGYVDSVMLGRDGDLTIAGWAAAVDRPDAGALIVRASIDGVPAAEASTGVVRDDVAHFWGAATRQAGFVLTVPRYREHHALDGVLEVDALDGADVACIEVAAVGTLLGTGAYAGWERAMAWTPEVR